MPHLFGVDEAYFIKTKKQTKMGNAIIPLLAAILGGFVGAYFNSQWQHKSDNRKDKKLVLTTIMAYRGIEGAEHDFIKALNIVDAVFYDNEKVRHLLHDYFKHLYRPLYDTGLHRNILLDLIHEMVKDIGYVNLKQTDIMDYYYPEWIGKLYPLASGKNEPDKNSPGPPIQPS